MDLKDVLRKLQFSFDLEKGWVPFLNLQVKWAVAFFVRTFTVIISIALVLVILKKIEITGTIRSLVMHDIMGVIPQGTSVISSPDINYSEDLKSLDRIIKMLESKKKTNEEDNSISN